MGATRFHIVAIGCSAGCLNALETFFVNIPPKLPVAFVVIQHLSRTHVSILDQLLQKYSGMPVIKVMQEQAILPGNVYVIGEDSYLTVDEDQLIVRKRPADPLNRAVDTFFKSLAASAGNRAVGLIFSGMGADGLEGANAIAEAGGVVYVQDPDTTSFKGMPQSVIEGDHPTGVFSPADLAALLSDRCALGR